MRRLERGKGVHSESGSKTQFCSDFRCQIQREELDLVVAVLVRRLMWT